MALWICTSCTAAYSVGAPKCPQCGATEHVQEGHEDMAKITRHSGLSNAAAADDSEHEGSEESSPTPEADGTTSSTSSEKPPASPATNASGRPKPARKTASPSVKAPTGSSTAPPTDGDPAADTSGSDA